MKKILTVIIIGLLCFSMFSMFAPQARAEIYMPFNLNSRNVVVDGNGMEYGANDDFDSSKTALSSSNNVERAAYDPSQGGIALYFMDPTYGGWDYYVDFNNDGFVELHIRVDTHSVGENQVWLLPENTKGPNIPWGGEQISSEKTLTTGVYCGYLVKTFVSFNEHSGSQVEVEILNTTKITLYDAFFSVKFELLSPATYTSYWVVDSLLVSGFAPGFSVPLTPSVAFNLREDNRWVLICGEWRGTFHGYYWSGSKWINDDSVVVGLANRGGFSSPSLAFNLRGDNKWVLISGDYGGGFTGYYWSGSEWAIDDAIVKGLAPTGWLSKPSIVFNLRGDNKWVLIAGETHNDIGYLHGYYWNGSEWIPDELLVAGAETVDWGPAPSLAFNLRGDNKWVLILGTYPGYFHGYYWSGSQWILDDSIVGQLGSVGYYSASAIFFGLRVDNEWELIAGGWSGVRGYCWFSVNKPPSAPMLSGPTLCRLYDKNDNYLGPWNYTASAVDPDGDDIRLTFSWDDGTSDEQTGFVSSGTQTEMSHSWVPNTGMHKVRAKATDIHGAESAWSSALEVTVVAKEIFDIWAGYFVKSTLQANRITSVAGEWIQPTFHVPEGASYQATWIGIGGVGGTRLLQAGIAEMKLWKVLSDKPAMMPFWMTVDEKGKGFYWIDFLHTADPGDTISTSITEDSSTPGLWHIRVEDSTKSWVFSANVEFNPDQTVAEWVHEPGAKKSGIASFDPITFLKAELTIGGANSKLGRIDPALKTYLFMMNYIKGGTVLTSISPISEYEQFSISYTGATSIPANVGTTLSLHSSADLHVYDSLGNHLGYDITSGFIDVQIPNSLYFVDEQGVQYALLFELGDYQVELVGKEYGEFHLNIVATSNDIITLNRWFNGTTVQGVIFEYRLDVSDQRATAKPDAVADLKQLKSLIESLPSSVFDEKIMSASKMKKVFSSKINEVILKVEAGNYTQAIDKLRYDIRAKMDGDSTAQDWIIDPATQSKLCIIIDHIIESIKILQENN